MASIENSQKYESEVEPDSMAHLVGEFVRVFNHGASLFYCIILK